MSSGVREREAGFRDPTSWVLVVTVVLLARVSAWQSELYRHNVLDDAYISLQYAKNLSLGRGLVFNPGEYVEGYSNFLWVLLLTPIMAAARALHWDPTRAAIGLNLIVAIGGVVLVYLAGRRLHRDGWLATSIALVLCTLDNAFQWYAVSGMENHLLAVCMLLAVIAWSSQGARSWLWTGMTLGLAGLTRPDAALFALAFALSMGIDIARPSGDDGGARGERARRAGLALLVWFAITATWFLWRWGYYGAALPNTFHLKVGGTFDAVRRGWGYTVGFVEDRYFVPLAALPALVWIRRPIERWLLLFVLLHVAWITYVGGDFYPGHRFYVALLPLVYLLVGAVCDGAVRWSVGRERVARALRSQTIRRAALAVVAIAVGFGLFEFTLRGMERGPYTREIQRWGALADANVRYMKWLATRVKPGESMVLGDIGAAGFFADVRVVDVFGVVDPRIAGMSVPGFGRGKPGHEKIASPEYLLAKGPTYVKWGWIPGDLSRHGYYAFTEFPKGIEADGLWVREDMGEGRWLEQTAMHFDPGEMTAWEGRGEAFSAIPTSAPVQRGGPVLGHAGWYLSSFDERLGDAATGKLTSPEFALVGDRLVVRVGGGRDPIRLRVSLLVAGEAVAWATGHDREVLGRRAWDISRWKGKSGRIEVVDEATGAWGHVLVDEVIQWSRE